MYSEPSLFPPRPVPAPSPETNKHNFQESVSERSHGPSKIQASLHQILHLETWLKGTFFSHTHSMNPPYVSSTVFPHLRTHHFPYGFTPRASNSLFTFSSMPCSAMFCPWPDISSGEGNDNPLQYSCLENSMNGGAWYATVHGVAKSWTRLSDFTSDVPSPLTWSRMLQSANPRMGEGVAGTPLTAWCQSAVRYYWAGIPAASRTS